MGASHLVLLELLLLCLLGLEVILCVIRLGFVA